MTQQSYLSVVACFLRMNANYLSTLNAAIYCRKSTESEDRQILSLPAQREEAGKLAGQLGILNTLTYEEAKSAKLSGRRSAFNTMIKDLRLGRVNAIICWKLDRLARNMVEGGVIIDLLQKGRIKAIITPFKVYYPDENALILSVEFGAANQYSRDLSQNVTRGLIRKAQIGAPNGRACIGFLNDKTAEKGLKKWHVDKERFPIVKEIFAMYLSGNYSGDKIHKWAVTTAKLTTRASKKRGNTLISRSGLYRMLSDPIYAGFFYLQGEQYELSQELPRVISMDEHRKILRMLNGKASAKTKDHTDILYRGHIKSPYGESVGPDVKMQVICDCKYKFSYLNKTYCPRCKAEINGLINPKYLHYVYYRNIARAKRRESIKYISEQEITKAIIDYVAANLKMSIDLTDFCIKRITELDKQSNDAAIEVTRQKRINELNAKKQRYRARLADGLFSEEEYLTDVTKINEELAQLLSNHNSKKVIEIATISFSVGLTFIEAFKSKTSSVDEKRHLLALFGANLTWNEKYLIITPTKVIQCIIDGLNKARIENRQFTPENSLANKDKTGVFQSVCPILCAMCDDVRNLIKESTKEKEGGH